MSQSNYERVKASAGRGANINKYEQFNSGGPGPFLSDGEAEAEGGAGRPAQSFESISSPLGGEPLHHY